MEEIEVIEVKHGWFAFRQRYARFAGFGAAPQEAVEDLDRAIAAFHRSVARSVLPRDQTGP